MIIGRLNIVLSFYLLTKVWCTPAIISNSFSEVDDETPKGLLYKGTDDIEMDTIAAMSYLLEKHKIFLQNYMDAEDSLQTSMDTAYERVQSEGFRRSKDGLSKNDMQFRMMSVSKRDVNRVKSLLQEKYEKTEFEALNLMKDLDHNTLSVLLYYTNTDSDSKH